MIVRSAGLPVFFLLLFIVGPVFGICTAVSAASLPSEAFDRVGTSRTLWIVLPLIGIAFCGVISFFSSIAWFAGYRSRVQAAARELPPSPPPPTVQPAGWHPDPSGRHELRYFDGTRWTEHVSDHGTPGTDPL